MSSQNESPTNRNNAESIADLKKLKNGIFRHLPTTFQPFFNQQFHSWHVLFPYERRYLLDVLTYLDQLSPDQRSQLFRPVRQLEKTMGVNQWDFSVREQTLEDASLLARSPYYLEWRREVEGVFGQIERGIQESKRQHSGGLPNRLILMIYPPCLPLEPSTIWKRWPDAGKVVRLDQKASDSEEAFIEGLLGTGGQTNSRASSSLREAITHRASRSFADVWAFDAGTALSSFMLGQRPHQRPIPGATVLSFERLKAFRENYLTEVNSMNHNLSSADEIYGQLRKEDVSRFCPPEIKT